MKRMIVIWCVLIGIVLAASFLQPNWSVTSNPWTVNALILLSLLLFIEIGLLTYRNRIVDITEYLQNHRSHSQSHDYPEHYISNSQNKEH